MFKLYLSLRNQPLAVLFHVIPKQSRSSFQCPIKKNYFEKLTRYELFVCHLTRLKILLKVLLSFALLTNLLGIKWLLKIAWVGYKLTNLWLWEKRHNYVIYVWYIIISWTFGNIFISLKQDLQKNLTIDTYCFVFTSSPFFFKFMSWILITSSLPTSYVAHNSTTYQ